MGTKLKTLLKKAPVQHNPGLVDLLYGTNTATFASRMIRSSLIAGPGKDLFCADYSSIECRMLARLADETKVEVAALPGD